MTRPSPTDSLNLTTAPSDSAAVIAAMEALHGADTVKLTRGGGEAATALVLPKGMEVRSIKPLLDEYLLKPDRRRGTAKLGDATSFVAHLKRFASRETAVFINPDRAQPTFTAVFDYHPAGGGSSADWLQHRGVYAPALSDRWRAWLACNGKAMPQADFAAFIEEHVTDLIVPNLDDPDLKTFANLVGGRFAEPSDLVQLSRGLELNVETVVKNAVTLGTGEISIIYDEVHRDGRTGAPISIANLFQICIPVFYAGTLYKVPARLRYRNAGGKLLWSYLLVQPELAFDDAIAGVKKLIEDDTDVDVFLGSPEA